MYGFRTLSSLNRALYDARLGRLALTQDEWTFGIDNRKAYTFEYLNVASVLSQAKREKARDAS